MCCAINFETSRLDFDRFRSGAPPRPPFAPLRTTLVVVEISIWRIVPIPLISIAKKIDMRDDKLDYQFI